MFCEIRNIATFLDLRGCFGFHKQIPKTLWRSKSLQNSEYAESATVFAESKTICGIHKQIIRQVYVSIELLRKPQL